MDDNDYQVWRDHFGHTEASGLAANYGIFVVSTLADESDGNYTAGDLTKILKNAGYKVAFATGVGFLTPISLLPEFKVPIVTRGLAVRFEKLDTCFPNLTHLFLIEAEPNAALEAKP